MPRISSRPPHHRARPLLSGRWGLSWQLGSTDANDVRFSVRRLRNPGVGSREAREEGGPLMRHARALVLLVGLVGVIFSVVIGPSASAAGAGAVSSRRRSTTPRRPTPM